MFILVVMAIIAFVPLAPALAGEHTVISIHDRVLVTDVTRFGVNLGNDNYSSGAVLIKQRTTINFEGTTSFLANIG